LSATVKVWVSDPEGVDLLGPLPDGVTVEVYDGDGAYPSDPAEVEFWTPPFLSGPEATRHLARMTGLRVIQLPTAGAEIWVDKVPERVTLCDARGAHTSATAEWVVAAILSHVRCFPRFVRAQDRRKWDYTATDTLDGKRVLIVGAGSIGEATAARLAPFGARVTSVARRPRPGVHGVQELPDLLGEADIVVLLVPLTDQTRGMVDADFLRRMPDGALLVNAARGAVVDTAALTAELASGRLAAALDVTDPEPLPPNHPLWTMPNVFITPHIGGSVPGGVRRIYTLVREQLHRYLAGEELINVVRDGY